MVDRAIRCSQIFDDTYLSKLNNLYIPFVKFLSTDHAFGSSGYTSLYLVRVVRTLPNYKSNHGMHGPFRVLSMFGLQLILLYCF